MGEAFAGFIEWMRWLPGSTFGRTMFVVMMAAALIIVVNVVGFAREERAERRRKRNRPYH